MSERINQLQILTAEILQRMDRREEKAVIREINQIKTNKLLTVISVAAIVISTMTFIITFYYIFG